jgi:hypothetical protein
LIATPTINARTAAFAYSVIAIVSLWILRIVGVPTGWVWALALVGVVLLAIGYGRRTEADLTLWDKAAAPQRQQLALLERIPRPPSRETMFVFGGRGLVAPGVFAFRLTWDLDGAARIMWNDGSIHAYGIFAGTQMRCDARSVVPLGFINGDGIQQAAPFGHAEFVDLRTERVTVIASHQDCEQAASQFVPGSVF